MVTLYIGIADYEWFRYLSAREDRTGLDALLKAVARREIGSLQWSDGALNFGGCRALHEALLPALAETSRQVRFCRLAT
jgi:hypothetical protein